MQTSFARGLRAAKIAHSCIVAVPRPRVESTHDSLSETKTTSPPIALRRLSIASGAEQFVPPGGIAAILVALVTELMERQNRYRLVQEDFGNATCGNCPHGGCCRKEFVRVADLLPRLAVDIAMPIATNEALDACAFLGPQGCLLTPSPLPNICVAFHCPTLVSSGPSGFGEQITQLAQSSEDVALVLQSYLQKNYMLLDAEAEIDLSSPAVEVARLATLPLQLVERVAGKRVCKSVPHPSEGAFARLLPVLAGQ